MLKAHNSHTIKKHKHNRSLSSTDDEFIHSRSYESDLMFTFNTPINSRGSFAESKSPYNGTHTEISNNSHGLSYSMPGNVFESDIFTKRSNNKQSRLVQSKLRNNIEEHISDSDQSQETLEIGSFKSDMTQEIPSTLMMNVNNNQPPSYDSVVFSHNDPQKQSFKLPQYKQVVKENPSSKLETNTYKMNEILEHERLLSMPNRNSISLKDTFDLSLMSKNNQTMEERPKNIISEADDYSSSSDGEYIFPTNKKSNKNTMKNKVVHTAPKGNDDWLVTQFLIDEYSVHGRAYESKRRNTDHGLGRLQEDMFESSSDEE